MDPHIEKLFELELSELLEYLENCYFENKIMGGIEKIEWTWDKEHIYLASSSAFLDSKWLT